MLSHALISPRFWGKGTILAKIFPRRPCAYCGTRSIHSFRNPVPRASVQWLRHNSSSTKPGPKDALAYTTKRMIFPERLLIYHVRTGRIVFIGCLKLVTILIFGFFTLVIAPAHWFVEEDPGWVAPAIIISGTVPMLFVAYISSPFVNSIHLKIPHYARFSREILLRYSKNLPKNAEIDITTLNFIGKPQRTLIKVSDLFPAKERFGLVTFVRDTKEINKGRPWWKPRAVRQFGVYEDIGKTREGWSWANIAEVVKKNAR